MTPHELAEDDKKLLKMSADDHRVLALFATLISSNEFTPHETILLIKYVLDRYPHPVNNLPISLLQMLQPVEDIPDQETWPY